MTDRLLSMLYQYLLSNQNLELDKTFQIYFKILSVEHSKFKASVNKKFSRSKRIVKVHVGESKRTYNFKWAIDYPQCDNFVNKCLLICTILALAQLEYFESSKKNKIYLYLSAIRSTISKKSNYAKKLMNEQLKKLFWVVSLKQTGPYELKTTIILLSTTYKCQFFIFLPSQRGSISSGWYYWSWMIACCTFDSSK